MTCCKPTTNIDYTDSNVEGSNGSHQYIQDGVFVLIVFLGYFTVLSIRGHNRVLDGRSHVPPPVYVITPTRERRTQRTDLIKLCQTLRQVDYLHWVVVLNGSVGSPSVPSVFKHCRMSSYTLLHSNGSTMEDAMNIGLDWLRAKIWKKNSNGVVYFADDGYTYDSSLFNQIRLSVNLTVWPVGCSGNGGIEGPVIHDGELMSWSSYQNDHIPFPLNLSGFAVNVQLLLRRKNVKLQHSDHIANDFLVHLGLTRQDAMWLTSNRTLVWKTKTKTREIEDEKWFQQHKGKTKPVLYV